MCLYEDVVNSCEFTASIQPLKYNFLGAQQIKPRKLTSMTTARTFLGARRPRSRSGTLTTTFVPISTAGSLELERETIF